MRRYLFALSLMPTFLSAQIFKTVTMEKLTTDLQQENVRMAGISEDGRYAFTTNWSRQGLYRVDLNNFSTKEITNEASAGVDPVISSDGTLVLHQAETFDDQHLGHTALKMLDLKEGTNEQLVAPTRANFGYALHGKDAVAVVEGMRPLRKSIQKDGATNTHERPILTNQELRIKITENGVTRTFAPNGDDDDTNYIWASLSPNGKHVLYYVSDNGAYVSDLNGENVQFLGYKLFAPQWYDDQTIVGFASDDNGEFILSSAIVAYTLQGQKQVLTDASLLLMYPYCSSKAGRIVCSSPSGEMYVVNVTK